MKGSLYSLIVSQHLEQVVPMRCTGATLARLARRFCDLVADNDLQAFVVQGRCLNGNDEAELQRFYRISAAARFHYVFACGSNCPDRTWTVPTFPNSCLFEQRDFHGFDTGPFVLIIDPHFSGLLASERIAGRDGADDGYDMVWSFEPDVAFTALEYLIARVSAQHPEHAESFARRMRENAPSSASLRLTLSLTTKLALMLQRQTEIETGISRISSMVNSGFDLSEVYQSVVDEVGKTLRARHVSLAIWSDRNRPEAVYEATRTRHGRERSSSRDDRASSPIEVPLHSHGTSVGLLSVEDDAPDRIWEEEEVMMIRTVADHLAVGVSNARLFKQVEEQAIRDELTGLFNRRYFQDRLEHEIRLADRTRVAVSLVLFDLDHMKRINDTFGHGRGDAVLRHVARVVQAVVRTVDICARYGGEEFVVVLPHTDQPGAILAAERLRRALAVNPIDPVGSVTASFGVSTYPGTAASGDDLVEEADRAMYIAKRKGRNQVAVYSDRVGPHLPDDLPDEADDTDDAHDERRAKSEESNGGLHGRSRNL